MFRLICAVFGGVYQVLWLLWLQRGTSRPEQAREGLAKLTAHGAVNKEVDGIGKHDEQVDQYARHRHRVFAHDDRVKRVLVDEDDDEYGERELDYEKHPDDQNKH